MDAEAPSDPSERASPGMAGLHGETKPQEKPNMSDADTFLSDEDGPFWITGKALERHFSMQDALMEFCRLFRDEENDRALAIVGGAFLDTLLENILIEFLVDDEKEVKELMRYDAPMGTYAGRIRAAYCLGLLRTSVRDDLRHVGKIRNKFAHDLSASFADQEISSRCAALRWHRHALMEPPAGATTRDLFYVGVSQLVAHLNGCVVIARGQRRSTPTGD
jgi:DNA-binding MltR family transcriptional regulator